MSTGSASTPLNPAGVPDPAPDQPRGQDYLIRSEEQLHVGTQRVLAGYARLEKFVVTETKTITVEVAHEEIRLVHTAGEIESQGEPVGLDLPAAGDRWMTLSREEVVVTKRIVPVERVRLEVYPVTEQQQVTEQLRKEQIDTAPETAWTSEHDSAPRI